MFFIFKQKTAYEMRISDWSSDVCSSDLRQVGVMQHIQQLEEERHFLHRTAFHQGQDKLTLLQADKKIGVFAASGDPLEIKQAAEPVRGEKGFQLGPSQGSEHRQG